MVSKFMAPTHTYYNNFSPHSNRRQDSWEAVEKRTRFPIEVLTKVQHVVAEKEASFYYRISILT